MKQKLTKFAMGGILSTALLLAGTTQVQANENTDTQSMPQSVQNETSNINLNDFLGLLGFATVAMITGVGIGKSFENEKFRKIERKRFRNGDLNYVIVDEWRTKAVRDGTIKYLTSTAVYRKDLPNLDRNKFIFPDELLTQSVKQELVTIEDTQDSNANKINEPEPGQG